MLRQRLIFLIFVLGLFLPFACASAGTILSSHKYAWSDKVGYINFANVIVSDSALSGYAWSANKGFIKFNSTLGGVFNDGNGNLSGSAWGEQIGWIDFDGVSINSSTGQFSGTATGTLVGIINFDCPNFCDVRTDWSVTSSPITPGTSVVASSGGGTALPIKFPFISQVFNLISSHNEPLTVLPGQAGLIIQDTAVGPVVVEAPVNNFLGDITYTVNVESLNKINKNLVQTRVDIENGFFYNISAKDSQKNFVDFFPSPVTIILPLSKYLQGTRNLGVYWLNEVNQQWILIPDALFANDKVVFKVNHLSKFAILSSTDEVVFNANHLTKFPILGSLGVDKKIANNLPLPPKRKPVIGTTTHGSTSPAVVVKKQGSTPEKTINFFKLNTYNSWGWIKTVLKKILSL